MEIAAFSPKTALVEQEPAASCSPNPACSLQLRAKPRTWRSLGTAPGAGDTCHNLDMQTAPEPQALKPRKHLLLPATSCSFPFSQVLCRFWAIPGTQPGQTAWGAIVGRQKELQRNEKKEEKPTKLLASLSKQDGHCSRVCFTLSSWPSLQSVGLKTDTSTPAVKLLQSRSTLLPRYVCSHPCPLGDSAWDSPPTPPLTPSLEPFLLPDTSQGGASRELFSFLTVFPVRVAGV